MREVWMNGPIDQVPDLLQPVAHALLQARNEVNEFMIGFPEPLLWERPANVASTGFHLQHLRGVLDRLFTYSKELKLNEDQLIALSEEGKPTKVLKQLLQEFNEQIDQCIKDLQVINPDLLTETRYLGRKMIPTTMIGLLFHAAEHTMRHIGQLLVTVKILTKE
jgi:uncharacterized damage-inducible protein DinB